MADGFVFFSSYYDSIQAQKKAKDRLLLYEAICGYAIKGTEPDQLPEHLKGYFVLMKPNIDSSLKRRKASQANGKKGGAPEGNQNARKQPKNNLEEQPENNLNKDMEKDVEKEKEYDRDNIADKPPRPRFVPPTVEEVREYCLSRKNGVDPDRFVAYYTSNGWMVGRNKMKDWKSAVHTWERSEYNKSTEVKNGRTKTDNPETEWQLPGVIKF